MARQELPMFMSAPASCLAIILPYVLSNCTSLFHPHHEWMPMGHVSGYMRRCWSKICRLHLMCLHRMLLLMSTRQKGCCDGTLQAGLSNAMQPHGQAKWRGTAVYCW
jgi:hypothetical protein